MVRILSFMFIVRLAFVASNHLADERGPGAQYLLPLRRR
jgi:hypothetical protein